MFGWVNYRRAHVADAEAQQARALADQARGDAEKLVGFLIEDFYAELEPTGRLETMGKLAKMAVSYYDGLPAELLTPQTQAYRGMALVREGGALLAAGDAEGGSRVLADARELFEKLRADGDRGEAATLGLALSQFTRFSAWGVDGAPGSTTADLQQAVDLLEPLVDSPQGSRQARLVYADVLNYLSHRRATKEEAVATCEEARKILIDLGALDLSDLGAASVYADTSDSQARHALVLGRVDEAERLEHEVYEIAEKVLTQRPGDLRSMANRALAAGLLGDLAARRHDYSGAVKHAARSEEAGENYVRFNPSDLNSWVYWVRGKDSVADALFEEGRVVEAIEARRSAVALEIDSRAPPSLPLVLSQTWPVLAVQQARMGRRVAAERAYAGAVRAFEAVTAQESADSPRRVLYELVPGVSRARVRLFSGENAAALDDAVATIDKFRKVAIPADNVNANAIRDNMLRVSLTTASEAALRLGGHADAEAWSRERLALPSNRFGTADPRPTGREVARERRARPCDRSGGRPRGQVAEECGSSRGLAAPRQHDFGGAPARRRPRPGGLDRHCPPLGLATDPSGDPTGSSDFLTGHAVAPAPQD